LLTASAWTRMHARIVFGVGRERDDALTRLHRSYRAQLDGLREVLADDGAAAAALAGSGAPATTPTATVSVETLARRAATARATLAATLVMTRESHAAEVKRLQTAQSESLTLVRAASDDRARAEARLSAALDAARAEHAATAARLADAERALTTAMAYGLSATAALPLSVLLINARS
jgi:hypothetical protein